LFSLSAPALLNAAEITSRIDSSSGITIIAISGTIMPGDEDKFRTYAVSAANAVVILESKGGSTLSAIDIGKTIRLKGFATAVPGDVLCASACALVWLAGTPRFGEDESYIGFHASYVNKNGVLEESGVGNALVGAYLNQLGLSERAIMFVTSAPPQGIEWINAEKARLIGIDIVSLKSESHLASSSKKQLGVSDEGYNPIAAVKAFYAALSVADGSTAAALVVPEKRGFGPFNERNISAFFGVMKEPLQVVSINQQGPELISVRYRYIFKNGKACDGAADVTTTYKYGVTLIQGIRANC
jgi:hypothetical protein